MADPFGADRTRFSLERHGRALEAHATTTATGSHAPSLHCAAPSLRLDLRRQWPPRLASMPSNGHCAIHHKYLLWPTTGTCGQASTTMAVPSTTKCTPGPYGCGSTAMPARGGGSGGGGTAGAARAAANGGDPRRTDFGRWRATPTNSQRSQHCHGH